MQRKMKTIAEELIPDPEPHYLYFDQTTMCSSGRYEYTYPHKGKNYCEKCDEEVKEYED